MTAYCKIADCAVTSMCYAYGGSILIIGLASGEIMLLHVDNHKMKRAGKVEGSVVGLDVVRKLQNDKLLWLVTDNKSTVTVFETEVVEVSSGKGVLQQTKQITSNSFQADKSSDQELSERCLAKFSLVDSSLIYCTSGLTGAESSELQLYDIHKGSVIHTVEIPAVPSAIGLSPSAEWVALGSIDGKVFLVGCNNESVEICGSIGGEVTAITFNHKSERVVASSRNALYTFTIRR